MSQTHSSLTILRLWIDLKTVLYGFCHLEFDKEAISEARGVKMAGICKDFDFSVILEFSAELLWTLSSLF